VSHWAPATRAGSARPCAPWVQPHPCGVDVTMLLPGGATATGMIPDDVPHDLRARLLSPNVMAEPIRYLCSHASDGVTGARIVATEFATWLRERQEAQAG
jgi:hypothetical protein